MTKLVLVALLFVDHHDQHQSTNLVWPQVRLDQVVVHGSCPEVVAILVRLLCFGCRSKVVGDREQDLQQEYLLQKAAVGPHHDPKVRAHLLVEIVPRLLQLVEVRRTDHVAYP